MKWIFFIACSVLTSCAVTNQFQPQENKLVVMQQKVPGITMGELQEGLAIYKKNCSSCHALYAPSAFTAIKWEKELKEMLPKAKITDPGMQKKIRDYLFAMSK